MNIDGVLQWLEASAWATTIRESLLWFPVVESIHVIGLAMVFGTILILDLRLMGVASVHRPFQRVAADIMKWTWGAFAITVITGALMFITNAQVYFHNTYFRVKMLLLILAGLNMAAFELTAGRKVAAWDGAGAVHPRGRKVAVLSLAIWLGVIVTGRLIGFTTSRATVHEQPAEETNFDDLFTP